MQANGLNEFEHPDGGYGSGYPACGGGSQSRFVVQAHPRFGIGLWTRQRSIRSWSHFIDEHGGYLANYSQDVDGQYLSGAQIIALVSKNYSVNPRLLLALLEYRSGWVTNAAPQNVDYPLGFYDSYYAGLYRQLAWTANNLNRGYYLWRVNALSTLPLSDGTYVPLDPTINAGTAGVQYFLSLFNNRPFWDYDVSESGILRNV